MRIIAIETSHDDTSVVVYEDKKILIELSYSQTDFHNKFGGTVPEYASRRHADKLKMIAKDLREFGDLDLVDHIAFTSNPGLIGSLHTGRVFAHALGLALHKEVKEINHMYAHIFAAAFNHTITYPSLALIVSGGHTQLWLVKNVFDIELLGQTKDDAVGEVYDKIARKLEIGFPGGPVIDKNSKLGERTIDFTLKDSKDLSFSFSGLKTKVINYIHNKKQKGEEVNINDICTSFQEAVVEELMTKTKRAIQKYNPVSIILGGGVAANSHLRSEFAKIHDNPLVPELKYTTDNAKMIAMRSHMKSLA